MVAWSSSNVYLVKSDGTSSALPLVDNSPAAFTNPTVSLLHFVYSNVYIIVR